MTSWLQDWVRRQVRAELARVQIDAADPLRTYQEQAADIDAQLRVAANRVGAGVIVGKGVTLVGGRSRQIVGLELHDRVRLYDGCRLLIDQVLPTSGIVLEADVALNIGCFIDGSGGVRIKARSILGPYVVIVSSAHRIDPDDSVQRSGKDFTAVTIGTDVWIGAHAVVRDGITIGDRAVVGAGSIVTHDVAARAVVAGNPARLVRTV